MVFFTCSHCGESLKKNKVEKHYQTVCSRNPISVACVDCCKDFSVQTYPAHTKCVTEEEKYSAKGFQPKPSANKGELKQHKWQEVIQGVRESYNKNLSYNERIILDHLVKHENVPRKKVKFQNFLRSLLKKQYNASAADSVFDKIEEESKKNSATQKDSQLNESKEDKVDVSMEDVKESTTDTAEEKSEEKLSKKERKEKKKRAKYEAELKEIEANEMGEKEQEIETEGKKKKKSKNKVVDVKENGNTADEENKIQPNEHNSEINGTLDGEEKKSKKKKRKHPEENSTKENFIIEEEGQKKKKHKSVQEESEININNETEELEDKQEKKKKKNKKCVESEVVEESGKKKRKKEMDEDVHNDEPCEKKSKEIDQEEETSKKAGKTKFNWQETILQVLQSKEEKEMMLKRLKKKVLAEFESLGCGSATEEKNIAKFNKKVNHTPGVVVLKDVAKLVISN